MIERREFDVLVVGAGPAGMAAVRAASEPGSRVGVVDDNAAPGGQIWRGETWRPQMEAFEKSGAVLIRESRLVAWAERDVVLIEGRDGASWVRYGRLILATGARERFLPFPGWTRPNVAGAGGLQALVKGGLPIEGKRVVVAGSGPLLVAVAAYLRQRGALVPVICEQAPLDQVVRFASALALRPGKLGEAARLGWRLRGTKYRTGCRCVRAEDGGVVLARKGREWKQACDWLACGFGLVPNTEAAQLLGCRMRGGFVTVDEWQQTSVPGAYCAGEPTGIGGVDMAVVQGEIAGYAAVGMRDRAHARFRARRRAAAFRDALEAAFALGEDLKSLPGADTIVCRCEDVAAARLHGFEGWREAKLHTRCGMGPCQGRICGAAVEFLYGWTPDSIRPPLWPVRAGGLAEPIDEGRP